MKLCRSKQTKRSETEWHGNKLQNSLRMMIYMMSLIGNKKDVELAERSRLHGSKLH